MKSFLVLPLTTVNASVVWVGAKVYDWLVQTTDLVISLEAAIAIGGVASILPSAFIVWSGWHAKKLTGLHQNYIAKMEPWREEVLQRLTGVETTCSSCDIKYFREEIIKVLHGKTDEYQATLAGLELRVVNLEEEKS